ncbi:MAG: hypothetical protein AAF599_04030 [Bacteroidota bacterium]
MRVKITIETEKGEQLEVSKEYAQELVSHNFNEIEKLVEDFRVDLLPAIEHEILAYNQTEFIKKRVRIEWFSQGYDQKPTWQIRV